MSRRTATALVLVATLGLLVPSAAGAASVRTAAADGLRGSGYEGGGFQNTLAIGPSGTWLSGGDVAGISRSVDGGRTWSAANTGLTGTGDLRVASIEYAPTTDRPGRVLAGVGYRGDTTRPAAGALLESDDDGQSWRVVSRQVRFSAIDKDDAGATRPRATGRLLVAQPDGTLLAGTYEQGVQRSTDGGRTWRPVGVTGHIASLVARPTDADLLYAASSSGVWRSTAKGGATAFHEVPGPPAVVQELGWVAGSLYAAAGRAGLFRLDRDRWVRLGGGTLPVSSADSPVWTSVVGYRACGRTVLVAGSQTGGADSVVRSVDGGRTWHSAVRAAVPTVGGPSGPHWWLADRPYFLLGSPGYTAAQLALPPGSGCDRPLAVAGRSGIWESTAPGSAPWYPMVGRLGVTVVNSVAVDPHDPQRALAASFDWPLVASTDGFDTVSPFQPGKGTSAASGLGTAVTFDPTGTPSTAYLAAGSESGRVGEVYTSRDPTDPASWRSTGLADTAGGGLPFALTVTQRSVLLVAVQGRGIWRREHGTWSRVPGSPPLDDETRLGGSFASLADGTVFFLDLQSGLWRSSNDGAGRWQLIWRITTTSAYSGHLAVDPTARARLYVSVGFDAATGQIPGLCRIDAADTVQPGPDGAVPCVTLLHSARVGPVYVERDGTVLVTQRADTDPTTGAAQLCRSGPAGSAPWSDVSTGAFRATGGFASSLQVGSDGTAYVGLAGEGVLVGRPGPGGSAACAGA